MGQRSSAILRLLRCPLMFEEYVNRMDLVEWNMEQS
jgi:hypothetical protein